MLGWCITYFSVWDFLAFLLVIFLCEVFVYCSFAKKGRFCGARQKPGAADGCHCYWGCYLEII